MTEEELNALSAAMEGEKGDLLLFAADKNTIVYNVLGGLRLELGKQLGLIDENRFDFLWVTEFPLFEWSEEENRYVAMHHPFTMPAEEDLDLLETDPGKMRAKAYDIVLNGTELGGGSVRISDENIQERMFTALGFTKESAHERFGFLLDAFKYGVPPHAGLAYGLDRLVMASDRRGQHPRGHRLPESKGRFLPDDGSPQRGGRKAAGGAGIAITAKEEAAPAGDGRRAGISWEKE